MHKASAKNILPSKYLQQSLFNFIWSQTIRIHFLEIIEIYANYKPFPFTKTYLSNFDALKSLNICLKLTNFLSSQKCGIQKFKAYFNI
ncbi:hypothetical protein BpHYR1_045430 [Brachionus plicatilis]|uniref:Uncharacterized protein n=1 Tax=Brachionus plicatilis TaxID=10195 RepID=A0A3M7PLA1_BRAPC|nr:hypothetical protein BpHYR1_045430 [Brachionus plicatilis]